MGRVVQDGTVRSGFPGVSAAVGILSWKKEMRGWERRKFEGYLYFSRRVTRARVLISFFFDSGFRTLLGIESVFSGGR